MSARRGSVLIVVAGLASMLAVLALSFLMRSRSDAEESLLVVREIQARMMLTAGLQYVCEAARIGWDDPTTPTVHEESFGWSDIRDGLPGPRDRQGERAKDAGGSALFAIDGSGPRFPAIGGAAARCPMHVLRRPPCAIRPLHAANPIPQDPTRTWADLLTYHAPDPQPAVDDPVAFRSGDRNPRAQSTGMAWFRIYRESIATFVITCGAGATLGYADFTEAANAGDAAVFGTDADFSAMRAAETVLHFRAEWNPSIGHGTELHYADHSWQRTRFSSPAELDTVENSRQSFGSILWIQRLREAPASW